LLAMPLKQAPGDLPGFFFSEIYSRELHGMSAIGTKRTIRPRPRLSAIGVTADIVVVPA
jgi:hypothetical protein